MLTAFGLVSLVLGALVSLINFYLSFVRVSLLRAVGQVPGSISGFPIIGSLLLLLALVLLRDNWRVVVFAAALALIDTGGIVWLILMLTWKRPTERGK